MKGFLRIFAVLVLLVVVDIGYFSAQLLKDVPSRRNPELTNVELIAVLTGGQGRIREAFDIFKNNQGKYLLISGVDAQIKLTDILGVHKQEDLSEERKSNIFLGLGSTSTIENAKEIVDFIELKEVQSVLLITSSYHYKRALSHLKLELKKRTLLTTTSAFAVESPNFPAESWWRNSTGWGILMSEYYKSLGLRLSGGYMP